MKIISHAITLLVSFVLVYIWEQTFLADYTIQVLGLFVVIYILLTVIRRKKHPNANFGGTADIFILNTTIFLLISLTGAIYSPLFFLLYFLGFGITFIFEPATVFLFTIGAALLFLPQAMKNNSIESYIRLGSLVLISPLAFFFGQEYKDRDKEEEEIEEIAERSSDAGESIAKDVGAVLQEEKEKLKPKTVEKLNDILEQTEDLRSETKEK